MDRDNTETLVVTVANGATRSSKIEAAGWGFIGLVTPAALTSTAITLEVSLDGGTSWLPVYDRDGEAITVTVAAGRYVALPVSDLPGLPGEVRLVMGTAEGAERELKIVKRSLN